MIKSVRVHTFYLIKLHRKILILLTLPCLPLGIYGSKHPFLSPCICLPYTATFEICGVWGSAVGEETLWLPWPFLRWKIGRAAILMMLLSGRHSLMKLNSLEESTWGYKESVSERLTAFRGNPEIVSGSAFFFSNWTCVIFYFLLREWSSVCCFFFLNHLLVSVISWFWSSLFN